MKELYESPDMEVIRFDCEDVIMDSNETELDG
jgi:hypothetical protein